MVSATRPRLSVLALVGFFLAIASAVLLVTFTAEPFGPIAILCTLIALVVSIIADVQINRSQGQLRGKGLAVAGIWISALWLAWVAFVIFVMVHVAAFVFQSVLDAMARSILESLHMSP